MKPLDFHSDCPKCGGGNPALSQHEYCWRSKNQKCPTWGTYGGEHLHRGCYECQFIFPVLPKDRSMSEEQVDDEWLNKKVDAVIGEENDLIGEIVEDIILLADDIDWEKSSPPRRLDLP